MRRVTHMARGFTLIEVLVAFVIVALAVATASNVFSTGLSSIRVSERHTAAALLVESILDRTGVDMPLIEGSSSGRSVEGLAWRRVVRLRNEFGDATNHQLGIALFDVEVTVSWGNGPDRRSLMVETVRIGELP